MDYFKQCLLYVLRAIGGFALAQRLTRRSLRILCYHGFSRGDEHQIIPWMFMRTETFERRLKILRKRRLPVIPLDQAIRRFQDHTICNGETVITLDDGWSSNLSVGLPLLVKYGYPACVYVTTEHLGTHGEVFNVILHYLVARSPRQSFTLSHLGPKIDGYYDLGRNRDSVTRTLVDVVQSSVPPSDRLKLLSPLADALELDLDKVLSNDRFRLVNRSEIELLFRNGVDVQLHTHSHYLPASDFECAAREIGCNRKSIQEITGAEPKHFCYPSGLYAPYHPDWLTRLGIVSATTCDPGLNAPGDSPMLLKRFLDYDGKPDIRFEAEICGVGHLARRFVARVGRLFSFLRN